MYTMRSQTALLLLSFVSLTIAHARIKHPKPLGAPVENPGGNHYNEPLRSDGSQFPCKGLHKKVGVNKTATETWQPGENASFEILGHMSSGEGNLAAHSGGSCQASLSFDNGETWKVLHTYQGGCPRDARMGSNIAGKNQTFSFYVPEDTRAGNALFSWSWIAVTGNRNEFYQNCASIMIAGSGNSTLDTFPDMFVGDMTIAGHIGLGECRSTSRAALEYPNPGEAITITEVQGIPFRKPSDGKCFAKASGVQPTTTSTAAPGCSSSLPTALKVTLEGTTYPCTCSCMKPTE